MHHSTVYMRYTSFVIYYLFILFLLLFYNIMVNKVDYNHRGATPNPSIHLVSPPDSLTFPSLPLSPPLPFPSFA